LRAGLPIGHADVFPFLEACEVGGMSDRDFLDLDDELSEGGNEGPAGEWDPNLLEDFPADDPAADDPGVPETGAETGAAPAAAAAAATATTATRRPRRRRLGPRGGGGALCFLLVVLAGLTLGTGLVTAFGVQPEALLDFSGFTDPLAIGDFHTHPVNAFWLAAVVVLAAAAMTAVAVERRVSDLRETARSQDAVLEAIRNLDPDTPESWSQEELQGDSDLAAVVSGLVGHYNLQQAKLNRYVGLEGELHRLEKAMAEECAVDLEGRWENPSAGSLADQAARLLAAGARARDDSEAKQHSLAEQGPDLVAGLRDVRGWHGKGLERLQQHGAALERLARQLDRCAGDAERSEEQARGRDRARQALVAIQQELAELPARQSGRPEAGGELGALIERASRLAFQIAMEVARLGAKGERLLPLTQDLEELTTELRAIVGQEKDASGPDDPRDRALQAVRGRLAELDPEALRDDARSDAGEVIGELAPVAVGAAQGLAGLIKEFAAQSQRLAELLTLSAEVTGIDPGTATAPSSGDGMLVEQFDPFAGGGDAGLVADPFTSNTSLIFDPPSGEGEFARTVVPGNEDLVGSPDPFATTDDPPTLDLSTTPELASEPTETSESIVSADTTPLADSSPLADPTPLADPEPPADPAPPADPFVAADDAPADSPAPADDPLPSPDDRVYDLSEFGAERLTDADEAAPGDRIYELSELGAERIP
jgi:hypothetical protein